MSDFFSVRVDARVAVVSMLQSTMPPAYFRALGETFRGFEGDPAIGAVVLRNEGRQFSYGLDLAAAAAEMGEAFAGGGADTRMGLHRTILQLQRELDAVARCEVPVIAAVHGWCIGGGLDLAAACDLRLASRDAKFSLRETRIAIVADLGSLQRLPPIIGEGATRELAFTGKDIGADKALRIGLVNELYDTREALDEAALAMAHEIAANPPLTVRGTKRVLDQNRERAVAESLAYVAAWNAAFLASEDLGEAIGAFVEKRKPRYQGR